MPPIPVPRRQERPPTSPEELYDRLTVTDSAIGALWRHQSHVLHRYYDLHRDASDVALELPTGAGKTLVGLLIADWRRRATHSASAFLCPTRQLAHQAHEKARGYGIPSVLLTGPSRDWNPADETRGMSGQATVISTYSHVFNSHPHLTPTTLVLDDAHAAESYVAQNWSVRVQRSHPAFIPVLEIFASELTANQLADLRNYGLSPHARPEPILVGPSALAERGEALLGVLDQHLERGEPASYSLTQVRGHVAGCLLYIGWSELLLRPFIPPTRFHAAFEDAGQRVYLSATLGMAGELERSFGRMAIPRIAIPGDWERHGSGRRLALIPLAGMDGGHATDFIKTTIAGQARVLVLVPSSRQAEGVPGLLPEDWDVAGFDDVDDRLEPFRSSEHCALVLANRYDGIDLPGEDCRVILIVGLPTGTHLQERFLFETVGARSALRERIRTRLMQGMGRATRSRSDRAVVLLTGEDLLMFLRDPGNLAGMRAELQAELAYGLFLSSEEHDLRPVVTSFLSPDGDWTEAEDYLRAEAEDMNLDPPDGAQQLQHSAREEVLACEAAWRGEPGQAAAHGQAAVRQLTVGAVGAYRTLWKVLAAHWAAQAANASRDALDARVANELTRDAAASARTREWNPPLPQIAVDAQADAFESRAVRIAEQLLPLSRSPRFDRFVGEAESWIATEDAAKFERALERLGRMLGFDSVRPGLPAAPDGAWRDGKDRLLWEAKSEQLDGGSVSAKIVRQANTHPTWVERELDWEPEAEPVTFLVSPRAEVSREAVAVAAEHVHLARLENVRQLMTDTAALWRELVTRVQGLTPTETTQLIASDLNHRGLTTDELTARLDAKRIAEMSGSEG